MTGVQTCALPIFYLEDDSRFIEAVNIGLASADRGEFVEHEEVKEKLKRILQS